ncbi:alpha-1,2-fucosyltransferase [Chryseobacterium sp. YR221]|uniref:alpha-1,2-fucosyltransferase n=1 Tax=Chryseobacterium sp. YR221 TaxID=1500293 RepID=UPI0009D7DFD6|nr:alpha-1,2-fucosyltransferase [Chryseobacterium sp. YR221]SMC47925.1 Glycosyl transferase family 11 [Chryseobacterium sp. YR221]
MIYVKISGGLGNQLFQYAFGQYTAGVLNTNVKYFSQTKIENKSFTKRELDIQKFDLPIYLEDSFEEGEYFMFNGPLRKIERKLIQKFPVFNKTHKIQSVNIHTVEKDLRDQCYYDGYWQNQEYPNYISQLLKDKIKLSTESETRLSSLISQIKNTNSVSIHIRRGDYMNIAANAKIFHICDMDYYRKAIQLIKEKIDNPVFFIFTEDKEWAKDNFKGSEFNFIEGNSAIEDMLLMSKCKNQIIANSTFSWWAAWLNKNENKTVIAPQNWYVNFLKDNVKYFIPGDWIKL